MGGILLLFAALLQAASPADEARARKLYDDGLV